MKKVILCSCLVAALLCCLIVPSFAADWFTSTTVSGYTLVVPSYGSDSTNRSALAAWLSEVGATSVSTAIGSCSITATNGGQYNDLAVYSNNGSLRCVLGDSGAELTSFRGGTFTIDGTTGYSTAAALSGATVTDITTGSDGFVTAGFSNGLGIAGIVANFCASNTYVLIAIGLAVAVPLVGWGISKLKSLLKGY